MHEISPQNAKCVLVTSHWARMWRLHDVPITYDTIFFRTIIGNRPLYIFWTCRKPRRIRPTERIVIRTFVLFACGHFNSTSITEKHVLPCPCTIAPRPPVKSKGEKVSWNLCIIGSFKFK
jgi:hypothetical protein